MSNKILLQENVGLILRAHASKPEDAMNRAKMIADAIAAARRMNIIGRIDVLVWSDKSYPDCDCGATAPAIRQAVAGQKDVFVTEVDNADRFCGILNFGIMLQSMNGVTHSIIASSEAASYMTPETGAAMIEAACKGAFAVPVAITELTQSILEGRGANTFMMWDNLALMKVGGFDLKAAKLCDDRMAHYMCGWNEIKGRVYYELSGVEEIIPLIRIANSMPGKFFIAPILPVGEGVKAYIVPDPKTNFDAWLGHISKMGTKFERQTAMAGYVSADLSVLKGAVMPEYRHF